MNRFTFTGRRLNEIAFPLGGIGTGSVSLGGHGELKDWEIFNKPNKGCILPFSFFILRCRAMSHEPIAKLLQAPPAPPYQGPSGYIRENGAGLPHMDSCVFRGEYPFANIDFRDSEIPLKVSMEAYNPFIPLNAKDSSIPCAIFRFTLVNKGRKKVNAALAASLFNAAGFPSYGQNVNTFMELGVDPSGSSNSLKGLFMTTKKYKENDPHFGSMALTTPWKNVSFQTCWTREGWFDSPRIFWDEFVEHGAVKDRTYEPSADNQTDTGAIVLSVNLEPSQSVNLPIYITWHFPNFEKYWDGSPNKPVWKNYYASLFKDAFDTAEYVAENEKRLYEETKLFHDTLFRSSLPDYVLDAVSSQASILKSPTCLRLEDGTFYGFEGCGTNCGCCEGSCTHVWNYAQTLAFLFPGLERSMRSADYRYNQFENGKMQFRIQLPLGSGKGDFHAAGDGQMGGLMKLYRDWQLSGDDKWLKSLWPAAKKALEYAWNKTNEDWWDLDKDGVMEGIQHNTYDIEFHGPNTMMGSFYMGALRSAEEIARYLGEDEKADEYRALFESGSRWMDKNLFNGEYYFQKAPENPDLKYQFKTGCLSDQMIGQWFAHINDMGYLFEEKKVKKAMSSIFKYNWKKSLKNHVNFMRVYGLNTESGLLICTWPKGKRPKIPFPYCDEIWGGGIEYQVGTHLIYEGLVKEGLAVIKGLRDRYDGEKRNPWNEMECGNHYARSMASWAALLALSGFHYSAPILMMSFSPRVNADNFSCFFSVDSGWGLFSQKRAGKKMTARVEVAYGSLSLQTLSLGNVAARFTALLALVNNKPVPCELIRRGKVLLIHFPKALNLKKEVLQIILS
ncbi:hypothetical protein AUJ67_01960 [Candidatus Desantisbacteria bacterium CG1_02_49_89]|nr:MAG: hypothetical protein AUJ67_01960 [Candidatus Desantisbacteria bacterium CG1_02_49_89]